MKGIYQPDQSWEKSQVFQLENGSMVTVGWNMAYGPLVTKIDNWRACNGLAELPEFAKSWLEYFANPAIGPLVRPKFTQEYSS